MVGAWRVLGGRKYAPENGFRRTGEWVLSQSSFSRDGQGAFRRVGEAFAFAGWEAGGGFLGIIWGNRLVGPWFLRIFADGKSVLKRIYEHHR